MDSNKQNIINKKINTVIENLERNNMKGYYVKDRNDIFPILDELIKDGDTVSVGGSMTLFECGIIDYLRKGKFNFLDRYKDGLSREDINNIYRNSFFSDVYFCSSNAITEDGLLYNVDGNSNRVAAILYGPKSVVVIVGINKIVKDISDAIKRVNCLAAPSNCDRLNSNTYCREKGKCMAYSKSNNPDIGQGCNSPDRICCNYVISAQQRIKDRIKVIIVGEELGY